MYDQSKAALREVLLRVDAGAYQGEDLIRYVELGAYSLCALHSFKTQLHMEIDSCRRVNSLPCAFAVSFCTDMRLLHVRTSNWVQHWQVTWERLKSCSVLPDKTAVVLQLFGDRMDHMLRQARTIDLVPPKAHPMFFSFVKRAVCAYVVSLPD